MAPDEPAPMVGLEMEPPFAFIPPEEARRVAIAESVGEGLENSISDATWTSMVLGVAGFVDGSNSERSQRARRAVHALCAATFIPEPLWNVAWAHSLTVAGVLYARHPKDRARRAQLLRALFAEYDQMKAELGRTA